MAKQKSVVANDHAKQRKAISQRENDHEPDGRDLAQERGDLSDAEFYARVARKAFERFAGRGGDPGRDVEDWLEAERQVIEEIRGEGRSR